MLKLTTATRSLLLLLSAAALLMPALPFSAAQAPAAQGQPGMTTFYLHDDGHGHGLAGKRYDWANTSAPYNPLDPNFISSAYQGIELNTSGVQQSFRWIAYPSAGTGLLIQGEVSVTLYLSPSNTSSSGISLLVQLQNGSSPSLSFGSVIAQNSTGVIHITQDQAVTILLPVTVPTTIGAGRFILLNVTRTDSNSNTSVYVAFDYNSTPSSFSLSLAPRISAPSLTLPPAADITDSGPITVLAAVSDGIGAYDVAYTTVTVTSTPGAVAVSGANMTRYSNQTYVSGFEYNAHLSYGSYEVNVTAYSLPALDGSRQTSTTRFNITVLPSLQTFSVSSPARATAGTPFNLTLTAISDSGADMSNFNGNASLSFLFQNGTELPSSAVSQRVAHFTQGNASLSETVNLSGMLTLLVSNGTATGSSGAINVSASRVASILVSPKSSSLAAGEQLQLHASGYDRFGNLNTTWKGWWSASSHGSVSPTGLFTASTDGIALVRVEDNATAVTGSANISITSSSLYTLVLTPATGDVEAGQTYVFTARGYDYYGNPVALQAVAWQTNAGTVSPSGSRALLNVTLSTMSGGWVEAVSGGLTALVNFNVTASPFSPQKIVSIPVQTWPSGSSWEINLTSYFTNPNDPTGSQLEWFQSGGSSLLYTYGSGVLGDTQIVMVPYSGAYGYSNLTITVRNSLGYSVTEAFGIHLLPRPSWSSALPRYITVPVSSYYSLNYTYFLDTSPLPPKSVSITTSSPYVFSSGLQLTYFFPASALSGSYPVVITATNAYNISSSVVQVVTVTSSPAPSVNTASAPPSSLTIDRGDNLTLEYPLETYFQSQGSLSFSVAASGSVAHLSAGNVLSIYSPVSGYNSAGYVLVTARSQENEYAFLMINLNILSVISPPAVKQPPPVYVQYSSGGQPNYSLPLSNYISDSYVPLSQVTVFTDSAYVTFSSVNFSLLFSMPPAASGAGNYSSPYTTNITLTIVGGPLQDLSQDSVSVQLPVHVSSTPPPGPLSGRAMPTFISFSENSVYSALNLSKYLFVPAGESVSYSSSSIPNLSVAISQYGQVTFRPGAYYAGNSTVYFRAQTQSGFYDFSMLVMISEVYIPPVITIPSALTVNSSSTVVNLAQYISNPNSEPLVISAIGSGVSIFGSQMLITMPSGSSSETITLVFTTPFGSSFTRQVTVSLVSQFPSIYVILFYIMLTAMLVMGGVLIYQRLIPKPFQLNSILLIHNDGRLIAHRHSREYSGIDRDILVGMFTAIQDFVATSFPEMEGEKQSLNRIELGRFSMSVERGTNAFLLAIYSGQPPRNWPLVVRQALHRIESRFPLASWDGKQDSVSGAGDELANLFSSGATGEQEARAEEDSASGQ